jgi:heptosyltransferase I
MKILVIKTSSMGDIIHTLPAVTDAAKHLQNLQLDWVVEETFAEIPSWHPAVQRVIPVALRRWRKNPFKYFLSKEWRSFYRQLRATKYDYIIDAQGLIKSAFLTRLAKGLRCGFARQSVREPLAACVYQKSFAIAKQQHAISRLRQLFAAVLNYSFDAAKIDYGLGLANIPRAPFKLPDNYYVFVTNTSSHNKRWSAANWQALLEKCQQQNLSIILTSGTGNEAIFNQSLAASFANVAVLPTCSLTNLLQVLAHAKLIVSVDTGLSHLAAACNKPAIVIYGPTNPQLIGTKGYQQHHLMQPNVATVWQAMSHASA